MCGIVRVEETVRDPEKHCTESSSSDSFVQPVLVQLSQAAAVSVQMLSTDSNHLSRSVGDRIEKNYLSNSAEIRTRHSTRSQPREMISCCG